MSPMRIATGLRRDRTRLEARLREADHRGDDHAAFALSDEIASLNAEIAAEEGVSPIGLLTERLPMEALA